MANASIKIDETKKDCGTKKYFRLTIDKSLAKVIGGRYHMEDGKLKLIDNPTELIGKTISLRSPLYCKSEKGICPTCYGDSYKDLKTKFVGVLAGGNINITVLNACATRSVMKSYCTVIK